MALGAPLLVVLSLSMSDISGASQMPSPIALAVGAARMYEAAFLASQAAASPKASSQMPPPSSARSQRSMRLARAGLSAENLEQHQQHQNQQEQQQQPHRRRLDYQQESEVFLPLPAPARWAPSKAEPTVVPEESQSEPSLSPTEPADAVSVGTKRQRPSKKKREAIRKRMAAETLSSTAASSKAAAKPVRLRPRLSPSPRASAAAPAKKKKEEKAQEVVVRRRDGPRDRLRRAGGPRTPSRSPVRRSDRIVADDGPRSRSPGDREGLDQEHVARCLEAVLRHVDRRTGCPWVQFNTSGWAPTLDVVAAVRQRSGRDGWTDHDIVEELVHSYSERQRDYRFQLSKDGHWCRARWGHTVRGIHATDVIS